jgi:lauroyl/myristoyl acyltransferase
MAEVVVEIAWGWRASAELGDRLVVENVDLVQRYVAERRSVILLTAHVCNWEWLLPGGGAHFGIPIDAVYKPIRVASLDAYMREARSRFGGKPIPIKEFAFELLRRAGKPHAYGMVADQTPLKGMDKHWTTFLPGHRILRGRGEDRALPRCRGCLRRDAAARPRALFGAAPCACRAAVRRSRRRLDH